METRETHSPKDHDISFKFEYVNSSNIGQDGCYNAGVYVVRSKRSGQKYIEKKYHWQDVDNDTAKFEMDLLRDLKHPNIVEYVGGFIIHVPHTPSISRASMYLEFCDKGNLWEFVNDRVKKQRPIGEPWIWDMLIQLVGALAFIQYGARNACYDAETPEDWVGVIHRDIKLDNVFLCSIPDSSHIRFVLGDFGQAMRVDDDNAWGRRYMGGNPDTAPPEVLAGHKYSLQGDVWSLGCTLSSVCCLSSDREYVGDAGPRYSEQLNRAIVEMMRRRTKDRPQMNEFALKMPPWRDEALASREGTAQRETSGTRAENGRAYYW
ncbi:MAG: hypothetical protein L6R37_004522 [Teloschistes peruensis]|nr:MAG: hypothetical protein L6R37_004522 [Teloschistes peruensis]